MRPTGTEKVDFSKKMKNTYIQKTYSQKTKNKLTGRITRKRKTNKNN
jgi:hypothetical protein